MLMGYRSAIHMCLRALLVFFGIQALACRTRTEWAAMEQRFAELSRIERMVRQLPERQRIAIIGTGYERMVAPIRAHEELDGIDDNGLEALYRAAQLAAFYTRDRAHVRDMASFLNMLQERGLASKADYVNMYETFIGSRMLTEARALARQHPISELEVLPELHEAPDIVPRRSTEWVVNPNKRELLHRNADLRSPAQVVIVAHPLCHFSRAAVHDIQADPVLGKMFQAHAKWLMPQGNRIDFDVVQQWNRQHPGQEVTLTFQREEWPMIDSWSTPTFYFLKNGAMVAKVEGWPKAGRRSELLAALRQIGLM
jgi:hypothetical protein